jgi:hypothetical protein
LGVVWQQTPVCAQSSAVHVINGVDTNAPRTRIPRFLSYWLDGAQCNRKSGLLYLRGLVDVRIHLPAAEAGRLLRGAVLDLFISRCPCVLWSDALTNFKLLTIYLNLQNMAVILLTALILGAAFCYQYVKSQRRQKVRFPNF